MERNELEHEIMEIAIQIRNIMKKTDGMPLYIRISDEAVTIFNRYWDETITPINKTRLFEYGGEDD